MSMYARRRAGRADATRARIVAAVRELLTEGSFHESTVEQVAGRAGVSRATLYQHFGTRLGLVDAMCETFEANPALMALRDVVDVEEFVARVVEFWADEEAVLAPLYDAAAVDPAAAELVGRQLRDRHTELRRLLRARGLGDRSVFAELAVLTSFETFRELRRHVGLPLREVTRLLQEAARRATG